MFLYMDGVVKRVKVMQRNLIKPKKFVLRPSVKEETFNQNIRNFVFRAN